MGVLTIHLVSNPLSVAFLWNGLCLSHVRKLRHADGAKLCPARRPPTHQEIRSILQNKPYAKFPAQFLPCKVATCFATKIRLPSFLQSHSAIKLATNSSLPLKVPPTLPFPTAGNAHTQSYRLHPRRCGAGAVVPRHKLLVRLHCCCAAALLHVLRLHLCTQNNTAILRKSLSKSCTLRVLRLAVRHAH